MKDIFNIRREFTLKTLNENEIKTNPIEFFEQWFDEALHSEVLEPNAMTLSTIGDENRPSSRIVLLKKIEHEGFVFFTNYDSKKGQQIAFNNNIALNFVWHEMERQVRIEGTATKISNEGSDTYFEARPTKSKLGAWASPQSEVIPDREYLEKLMFDFETRFVGKEILRPSNWGGYIVKPILIEFWQGRENRLHDRIQYSLTNNEWKAERLAP